MDRPVRLSAAGADKSYRLRDLSATTFRFRVKPGAQIPHLEGWEADILAYLQAHPNSELNDLRTYVPSLGEVGYEPYNKARHTVADMIDRGILEISGEVPLENVDPRYERVAKCDLCGAPSTGHPILFWKHNTPVVRCTSCGLVYANPRWKAEYLFGRYTPDYWDTYTDKIKTTAIDPARNQTLYAPPLNYLEIVRRNGRVLDVGCATGEFLAAAGAREWQVYGVEPSPIGAALAERVPGATIHTGTLDMAPWPDCYFDGVAFFEVIEHLQSPRAYIETIGRLLRPGGMLVMSTPNIHSLAYYMLGREWDVVGPNDHLYYFSPRTLQRLLRSCGFAIQHIHTMTTNVATWRRWLGPSRLRNTAPAIRALPGVVWKRFMLGDTIFLVARAARGAGKG
jgi:2-polyprenyl-3-methyl-5-hydroxy-6-metoxy-1,4-benzoquinol methylase